MGDTPESVAVLLVARDREDQILDAIAAAAHVVPGGTVHVVSNGSTDRTADLAGETGATVVETLGTLGTDAAVGAGVAAFRLTERYSFVLVLDADTRLPDGHLERALPLFDDPETDAVDAAATTAAPDRLPPRRILSAPRARRADGWFVPGRVYRASVLDATESWGETELDAAMAVRVAVCPGPPAVGAGADRLSGHGKRLGTGRVRVAALMVGSGLSRAVGWFPRHLTTTRAGGRRWTALGWGVAGAAAAAVVARVAAVTSSLPVSANEVVLAQAGYGRVAGIPVDPGRLGFTDRQLAVYTGLTDSFGRHADVLGGVRELSVVAAGVVVLGLLLVAARAAVPPLAAAAVFVVLAAAGPVVALLARAGPGVVAAAWLTVAAAAVVWGLRAVRTRRFALAGFLAVVAVAAAGLGLATAPLLVVPVGVGVTVWLWFLDVERYEPDVTWRGQAAVVLIATGAAAWFLWREDALFVPGDAESRLTVLAGVLLVAVCGLLVPRARAVAAGSLVGVGLAAGFGADADILLPALVVAAAVVVALAFEVAARWRRPGLATAPVAALTAVAAVVGALLVPPVAVPARHAALAAWVTTQLGNDVELTAPAAAWADLHRDLADRGIPVRRRADDSTDGRTDGLVVVNQPDGALPDGIVLGRFGSLTLLATDLDEDYLDATARAAAGARLAGNDRLDATEQVRAALRDGRVDRRVMAVLAGLCARFDLTVVATGKPAAERGSALPDRILVISTVDGRPVSDPSVAAPLTDFLDAQQAPYAPARTRSTADGLAVSWRLPAPLDGRTG